MDLSSRGPGMKWVLEAKRYNNWGKLGILGNGVLWRWSPFWIGVSLLTLLLSRPPLWCSGVLRSDSGFTFSLLLLLSVSLMMSYWRQNSAITAEDNKHRTTAVTQAELDLAEWQLAELPDYWNCWLNYLTNWTFAWTTLQVEMLGELPDNLNFLAEPPGYLSYLTELPGCLIRWQNYLTAWTFAWTTCQPELLAELLDHVNCLAEPSSYLNCQQNYLATSMQ